MKKMIYVFMILCFLISGCAIQKEENILVGPLKVGEYSQEKVTIFHELSRSNLKVEIECENYKENPTFKFHLYKDGKEIKEQDGVLFTDIRMDLIRNDDVLQVHEHVYYYDEKDAINNFAYSIVSDVYLQPGKTDKNFVIVKCNDSRIFRWEISEVMKGLSYSIKTGVYPASILYALYTYVSMILGSIFTILIFYHMNKYSITKEKTKAMKIYDVVMVVLFALVLLVDYSNQITLTSSPIDGQMIDAILKTILWVGLMIRLLICINVKNKWLASKKERTS